MGHPHMLMGTRTLDEVDASVLESGPWNRLMRTECIYTYTFLHKAQLVRTPPAMQETPVQFLGQEDPLEKG